MRRNAAPGGDAELHRKIVEAWLATQKSANTRAAYRLDLETFGAWCVRAGTIPLRADAAQLAVFQAAREAAGDSPATLRRRWSSMSSFYDFAVDNDAASTTPMSGVIRPSSIANPEGAAALLTAEAVRHYRTMAAALDPRLEGLIELLVVDGLKLGEALALDVTDLTGRAPKVTLTVRGHGVERRIVLAADTARVLRRCIARRADGPIFTSDRSASRGRNHRLTRFGADHLIRQLRTPSGEGVTTNALRRFHIATRDASASETARQR